jgi:DNA-directed RNA polymerase specialized sigma24 family protein
VTTKPLAPAAEHLLRELAPQVLGAVMRRFRDFAVAEDAVQEALIAAFMQWPQEGIPENPRGWLIQVASRRMTDHVRSDVARRQRETAVAMEVEAAAPALGLEPDMDPSTPLRFAQDFACRFSPQQRSCWGPRLPLGYASLTPALRLRSKSSLPTD